jgi:hypothetical protein
MTKKDTDTLVFRDSHGNEKKVTRSDFNNAARYAADHASHEVGKSHRPETTSSSDLHIVHAIDRSGRVVQEF